MIDRYQIWAAATSTVGAGAETKPWALNVPVTIQGVLIKPVSDLSHGLEILRS